MTLLLQALPEYLGGLAAAVTISLASWATRRCRARRARRPSQDVVQ